MAKKIMKKRDPNIKLPVRQPTVVTEKKPIRKVEIWNSVNMARILRLDDPDALVKFDSKLMAAMRPEEFFEQFNTVIDNAKKKYPIKRIFVRDLENFPAIARDHWKIDEVYGYTFHAVYQFPEMQKDDLFKYLDIGKSSRIDLLRKHLEQNPVSDELLQEAYELWKKSRFFETLLGWNCLCFFGKHLNYGFDKHEAYSSLVNCYTDLLVKIQKVH